MINISQGQFLFPPPVEKVIAGVLLVNFMPIDIYTNNYLEMIKFVISNMCAQTVILNNVTGSVFFTKCCVHCDMYIKQLLVEYFLSTAIIISIKT